MLLPLPVGFELEFTSTDHSILSKIHRTMTDAGTPVRNLNHYGHSDGSVWDLKTDSSCGWEAASPKIDTTTDLCHAAEVSNIVKDKGGRVNDRCGLHFHVDISRFTPECTERAMRFGDRYEDAFFKLAPSRVGNHFCRSINGEVRRIRSGRTNIPGWERYTWMNLRSVSIRNTIEFRLMDGSLEADHIAGAALFFSHLVNHIGNGKTVCWGKAKTEETPRDMFQTFLGQGGFYGPYLNDGEKKLVKLARQWALDVYGKTANEPMRFKRPTVAQIKSL